MGCGGSIVLDFEPTDLCGQGQEVFEVAALMELNEKHLGVMYYAYFDIDSDASGFIQSQELVDYFDLENNSLVHLLFSAFDRKKSGVLSFMEFVVLMYNICTQEDRKTAELFFFMNFPDRGYKANTEEVILSFEKLYNKKIRHTPALEVLRTFEARKQLTEYGLRDFTDLCMLKDSLMEPLRIVGRRLQVRIFGAAFWNGLMEKRRMEPLRNSIDFMYSIRDKVSEVNFTIKKEEHMKRWRNEVLAVKAKRKAGKVGVQASRKQSVLLAFFDGVTEIAAAGSKSRDKYHYADAKQKHSSADAQSTATLKPRRRKSILKPNLTYTETANGGKIAGAGIGIKKPKAKLKGGGVDMSRSNKKKKK